MEKHTTKRPPVARTMPAIAWHQDEAVSTFVYTLDPELNINAFSFNIERGYSAGGRTTYPQCAAVAARLIACWKACEGIDDTQLAMLDIACALDQADVTRQALRDCIGAIEDLRTQVDQMRGMFNDDDGAIEEADTAGLDALAEATKALTEVPGGGQSIAPMIFGSPDCAGFSRPIAGRTEIEG